MHSYDLFCHFACLFSCVAGGGGGGGGGREGGGVNGLGQLYSLRTGPSHHVQMKFTSYGIIFTKVD